MRYTQYTFIFVMRYTQYTEYTLYNRLDIFSRVKWVSYYITFFSFSLFQLTPLNISHYIKESPFHNHLTLGVLFGVRLEKVAQISLGFLCVYVTCGNTIICTCITTHYIIFVKEMLYFFVYKCYMCYHLFVYIIGFVILWFCNLFYKVECF